MNQLQTYKFNGSHANLAKLNSIKKLGFAYKAYYNKLVPVSLSKFYKNEGFLPKYLPTIPFIKNFSERYKQTCGKQVKSNINSWTSNIKNRIIIKIHGSSLPDPNKKILFTINKYGLWFKKELELKGCPVSQDILKLSRKIFHKC
jgi:hypothetical protein